MELPTGSNPRRPLRLHPDGSHLTDSCLLHDAREPLEEEVEVRLLDGDTGRCPTEEIVLRLRNRIVAVR